MEKEEIYGIFRKVIEEASTGIISANDAKFAMLFETMIDGEKITLKSLKYRDIASPILHITDLENFKILLKEYVDRAYIFYGISEYQNKYDIYKELIALLWSNATLEDFLSPNQFLEKRIEFFNNPIINVNKKLTTLNASLYVNMYTGDELAETPYYLNAELLKGNNSYHLPRVYFGIYDNKAYIYAIQNKDENKNNEFFTQIKRSLYKVNDGFNEPDYNDENLRDITPSFVLVANILLGLLKCQGIREIVISSYLPMRYINKQIIQKNNDLPSDKKYDYSDERINLIQSNITDKFIRTFRRLEYHHSGVQVLSYPMDFDSNMHMVLDSYDDCNNALLHETFHLTGSRKR